MKTETAAARIRRLEAEIRGWQRTGHQVVKLAHAILALSDEFERERTGNPRARATGPEADKLRKCLARVGRAAAKRAVAKRR